MSIYLSVHQESFVYDWDKTTDSNLMKLGTDTPWEWGGNEELIRFWTKWANFQSPGVKRLQTNTILVHMLLPKLLVQFWWTFMELCTGGLWWTNEILGYVPWPSRPLRLNRSDMWYLDQEWFFQQIKISTPNFVWGLYLVSYVSLLCLRRPSWISRSLRSNGHLLFPKPVCIWALTPIWWNFEWIQLGTLSGYNLGRYIELVQFLPSCPLENHMGTVKPGLNDPFWRDSPVWKPFLNSWKVLCTIGFYANVNVSGKTTFPWHPGWLFQTGFSILSAAQPACLSAYPSVCNTLSMQELMSKSMHIHLLCTKYVSWWGKKPCWIWMSLTFKVSW